MECPTLPGLELPPPAPRSAAEVARRERDRLLTALHAKAGETFREAVYAFLLAYLEQYGPTAGEVLVNECKAAGIVPPASMDDRAYGPAFIRASLRKQIRVCGQVPRLKGHHTGGGNVWERVR